MNGDPFLDEDYRVLTPEAFEFVLSNELKRALRSQNYLTLLLVEPTPRPGSAPAESAAKDQNKDKSDPVQQIARVISREVRETDLLCKTKEGRLSVVLLDADLPNSMRVVERLLARFEHYEFSTPLVIGVGAACCPTHGADAETLRRAAESRPVRPARESRSPNTQ
ncbi:MAG: hypothetical protein LC753_01205 [Acidobacteria bacterium]|nr:hypothetical protein [Acidobacteriota bacterium]MCA1648929.1 hypothetical protein [Acidobacteriota bacterium]